ncbi:MAG: IclR family transcriptional regulator [Ottowia sp.]|uniref:IclR family transcriptional regulator n=1 Tax=Ottowia sp. TaxID=1898956 RepID=UPI003C760730
MASSPSTPQRGVAAVETAAFILEALRASREALGLAALAQVTGLPKPQLHHYLVSLCRSGLVRRSEGPVRYALGDLSIRLGLTAVDRLEVQHFSAPFLAKLSEETGYSSFFCIWQPTGAVIVRWQQGLSPLTVFARLGTKMSLLHSVTGIVFSGWLPPPQTAAVMASELRAAAPRARRGLEDTLRQRIGDARKCGVAVGSGIMLPDVAAISAPVLGAGGTLAGALTLLGLVQGFDWQPDGENAAAMRRAASEFSAKLGYDGLEGLDQ